MASADVKKPKRKRKKSPTAMALEDMRALGYLAWIVESVIPRTFIKRDFMGWADIIYLTEASIVGVQVTSGDHHAARTAKVLAEPRAKAWLKAGGIIEVWSYVQYEKGGEWMLRKEEVVIEDFEGST